ncbi:indole-3-glycerol phosphate synthase TrpC [Parvularcula maris]|uniref:Indole-3-glycerol phosphate synthase n=1 Tax=Parvularcula maris TaxID=2965077 RepID=A0A9X2L6Y9_9PROT|nr:indole-3-glycerol phosphate synthase TrpC [Parvularcula maris]MCQ8184210.1 indole-3-glycerol phosphate synthase TrpC [Parvularcula maris]
MTTVLDRIMAYKREEVAEAKKVRPIEGVAERAQDYSPRGFATALHEKAEDGIGIIAEVKKASPSKGLIRKDFEPGELAAGLEAGGAACLSVLTDTPSFQGHLSYLEVARSRVSIPILRKDFMVDPYQVAEARAAGADAILLILAALTDAEAASLREEAAKWGLDVLAEVHDAEEMERALRLEPDLLGVNNRDLRTFETRIETTLELAPSASMPVVSESGVDGAQAMKTLMAGGIRRFLIGEHLMRQPSVDAALRDLLQNVSSSKPSF